ncbi:MAG: TM2 domain-containing protein [Bacteroidales bacterium]|nr:TM2 domain-containing protein [Bacteroidales bacterium]
MKIFIKLVFILVFSISFTGVFANYSPDFARIDKVVNEAKEVDLLCAVNLNLQKYDENHNILVQKNPFVAWLLTYSIVGFHRLYLGTDFGTFAAYFITLGGFLILDVIDYAVLMAAMIDHRPIDKYVNNPKLLMWN